jgi:hypothetical protein
LGDLVSSPAVRVTREVPTVVVLSLVACFVPAVGQASLGQQQPDRTDSAGLDPDRRWLGLVGG